MSSHASPHNEQHSHAESHSALSSAPVRIAAISLIVTASLLVLKLVLGLISGSIAVLSDAVDSGTDLVGGMAALLSIQYSRQPADEGHPYGHGKIEAVSASVAATIIGLGGGFITYQAVHRLVEGSPNIDVGVGLAAMIVAVLANVIVSVFMQREARTHGSMALKAEATHLRTNVVQAGTIIIGLLLVLATDEAVFDPLAALVLAAYMAWTAIGLVKLALNDVLDSTLPPQEVDVIVEVLRAHEGEIRGYHRLRTRRSGTTREIDMHVLFDAARTVTEVHETSDHIADEIHARLPGSVVVIHVEPDDGQEHDSEEGWIVS
ncbi:MAG: cation diffusion facilitator family transporter [Chloroflexota bacterium]